MATMEDEGQMAKDRLEGVRGGNAGAVAVPPFEEWPFFGVAIEDLALMLSTSLGSIAIMIMIISISSIIDINISSISVIMMIIIIINSPARTSRCRRSRRTTPSCGTPSGSWTSPRTLRQEIFQIVN